MYANIEKVSIALNLIWREREKSTIQFQSTKSIWLKFKLFFFQTQFLLNVRVLSFQMRMIAELELYAFNAVFAGEMQIYIYVNLYSLYSLARSVSQMPVCSRCCCSSALNQCLSSDRECIRRPVSLPSWTADPMHSKWIYKMDWNVSIPLRRLVAIDFEEIEFYISEKKHFFISTKLLLCIKHSNSLRWTWICPDSKQIQNKFLRLAVDAKISNFFRFFKEIYFVQFGSVKTFYKYQKRRFLSFLSMLETHA